jgi:alkylation response protein AidB-like acyl-CoA dehydrogenase
VAAGGGMERRSMLMERLSPRERRRGVAHRMDFDPTPEQAALRERVEAFCRQHCTDADAALLDQCPNAPDGLYHALAEAGLLGYCLPAAHGGGGGGPVEACIINEVLARSSEAMRLLTYHAAWLTAQGRIRPREISMAKLYASERLPEIVTRGMRLLGGRAYFTDSAMPRRLREALLTLYAGGTAEIQRNVVARSLGL